MDGFAALTKCAAKWDTVSRLATDRARQRTEASHAIDRQPVTFDFDTCEVIQSERKVPHLHNANGGDIYVYPAFVLVHVSRDAFAVVDIADVEISAAAAAFIEEESVPSDTRVLKQTWKKANKDGSPDRRFANNHQIPVVEYGRMSLTSPSGLNEEYMVSNFPCLGEFASRWKAFKRLVQEAGSGAR